MTDIDIITPCLNMARFLPDALASVRSIGEPRLHHVVVDGGSDDGTIEMLRQDQEIKWVSEPDAGQSDALNKGLAMGTAPWVGWLNADEFYFPHGLRSLLLAAEKTGSDVAYGDAVVIDEAGRFVKLLPQHPFSKTILRWYGPFPSSCACVFRRSVLETAPWDPSLKTVMDWDLYLRLWSRRAKFHYVPVVVGAFRYHDDRATLRHADQAAAERARVRARYEIPGGLTFVGHGYHRLRKLTCGSYLRQLKAHDKRGRSMRWFAE